MLRRDPQEKRRGEKSEDKSWAQAGFFHQMICVPHCGPIKPLVWATLSSGMIFYLALRGTWLQRKPLCFGLLVYKTENGAFWDKLNRFNGDTMNTNTGWINMSREDRQKKKIILKLSASSKRARSIYGAFMFTCRPPVRREHLGILLCFSMWAALCLGINVTTWDQQR